MSSGMSSVQTTQVDPTSQGGKWHPKRRQSARQREQQGQRPCMKRNMTHLCQGSWAPAWDPSRGGRWAEGLGRGQTHTELHRAWEDLGFILRAVGSG